MPDDTSGKGPDERTSEPSVFRAVGRIKPKGVAAEFQIYEAMGAGTDAGRARC